MVGEGTLSNGGNKYSAYIFCGIDMLSKVTFLDPKKVRNRTFSRKILGTFASAKIRPAFFFCFACSIYVKQPICGQAALL